MNGSAIDEDLSGMGTRLGSGLSTYVYSIAKDKAAAAIEDDAL